jgi:hypothetical protein
MSLISASNPAINWPSKTLRPVAIDHASLDDQYKDHPTPRIYKIESYISVPIVLPDGRYFGNLCAIDPEPAQVSDPKITGMFKRFATLIASELDSQLNREEDKSALKDERATSELREQFIAVLDFARGRLGGGIGIEFEEVDNLSTDLHAVVKELQDGQPISVLLAPVRRSQPDCRCRYRPSSFTRSRVACSALLVARNRPRRERYRCSQHRGPARRVNVRESSPEHSHPVPHRCQNIASTKFNPVGHHGQSVVCELQADRVVFEMYVKIRRLHGAAIEDHRERALGDAKKTNRNVRIEEGLYCRITLRANSHRILARLLYLPLKGCE